MTRWNWDDLRVFLAVAKTESLSGAATLLGSDQSTVGRRLSTFERALGALLFERGARGCTLTDVGRRVLDGARAVELEMHRFVDTVEGEETEVRGTVRIALTEGLAIHFLVPKVLPRLRASFPKLRIELVTGTKPADLLRHEADVALRFFRDETLDLSIRRLGKLRRAVLATREWARAAEEEDPRRLPWIGSTLDAYEGLWLREIGVPTLALASPSYETQMAALRAGLGLGLSPLLFRTIHPELRVVPGLPTPPPLDVFLATRASSRRIPRVARVCAAIRAGFSELLERERRAGEDC